MAEPIKDSHNNVSLEELLRFKRAERPGEAFWEQFDSELHQRMMQTLVKKDPWFIQILRGLSGKVAQSTAIAAAAAVLALMVIQPALIGPGHKSPIAQSATTGINPSFAATGETEQEAVPEETGPVLLAEADYRIESLSAASVEGAGGVTKDFGLDHLDVASYDRSAYTADMALSGFTSAGVASIVY